MKFEKREPLDLSGKDAFEPVAQPDDDFELPLVELAPPDSVGALAPPPSGLSPTHAGAGAGALPHIRPVSHAPAPGGRTLYAMAAIATILWAALSLYAVGYQWPVAAQGAIGSIDFQPYQLAVFLVFALTPIGFIWIAAFGMRQGQRLAAEAARTSTLAKEMFEPAVIAAGQAGAAVDRVRLEIRSATAAAAKARAEILGLHQALAEETERLSRSADGSVQSAEALTQRLSQECEAIEGLTSTLGARSQEIEDSITRQARMVAEASDLAQTQIGEAEAALSARAADLAAAAGDASEAARIASDDLARQAARLETATLGISDQVRAMEDTLTQERAALVQLAHEVRADQEDFAIAVEAQRAQLTDVLVNTKTTIADLNETASAAADTLGQLTTAAAEQAKEVAETARAERDLLAASALQSLGALSEAAKFERERVLSAVESTLQDLADGATREREAMEQDARSRLEALADSARAEREALEAEALRGLEMVRQNADAASRLAETHNENARKKLEQLSETAFAASQQAERAFQARLDDAKELIARSAELIDQAAAVTADRIDNATTDARRTLAELDEAITEFERRIGELPGETTAQAKALKDTLAHGMDSLLASARAAAEETQAIDAAFQERVRRNYEMLSEAVRLMGVVSARPSPGPAMPTRPAISAPKPSAGASEPSPPPAEPRGSRLGTRGNAAASAGLRPRLKLAPTSADAEVSQVFEAAHPQPATSESGGWSWQDLLSSMDDAPVDERQLLDRLLGEIEALGVDPAVLMPPARIDEIAAVLEVGDSEGVRAIVRRLAPTAVRRLTRRALAEKGLRTHVERFIKSYGERLTRAASRRAGGGETVMSLLSCDEGRAYLLFDAAIGERS